MGDLNIPSLQEFITPKQSPEVERGRYVRMENAVAADESLSRFEELAAIAMDIRIPSLGQGWANQVQYSWRPKIPASIPTKDTFFNLECRVYTYLAEVLRPTPPW